MFLKRKLTARASFVDLVLLELESLFLLEGILVKNRWIWIRWIFNSSDAMAPSGSNELLALTQEDLSLFECLILLQLLFHCKDCSA